MILAWPARRKLRPAVVAATLAFCVPVSTAAQSDPQTDLRQAAETLATWGVENKAYHAVLAGLAGLLAAGVTMEPDDPWRAHEYARILREIAVADPLLLQNLSLQLSQPRGVVDGISRIDAVIEPGETLTVVLKMAQDENALVEARVKRGAGAAEIDLIVMSLDGEVLASDVGAVTGVAGTGTFAQWYSQNCESVEVTISNPGKVPAPIVMMAPPSRESACNAITD